MKIPRSAIHFLVALETIAMIVVIVLCVVHPWAAKPKNDLGSNNTEIADEENRIEENTENTIGTVAIPEEIEVSFSEAVLSKVDAMTLEQKVAQMFIITPEALTDLDRVTVAGNATRNAINQYPVGGLVYSSINFQGKTQTINMLKGVQDHYTQQIGTPVFLMIEEQGGAETSPLATVNGYTVEAAPAEIGASGEAQKAIDTAKNISTYLKQAGFNTNLAPNVEVYSQDASVSSIMVAETVSTYGENGILTVMSTFTSEAMVASESDLLVYKAGINAGVDAIMVADATTEIVKYLRDNMQYGGILMADASTTEQVVASVQAGADMIYCPENFKEAYESVIDAVNAGTISQEDIDTAVARILTCKEGMENQ